MEYRKINHGAKKQNSQEISPRARKNYQQQQWGQKDSIIRRKKNATANYNMLERRKRKYVLIYIIEYKYPNDNTILENSENEFFH